MRKGVKKVPPEEVSHYIRFKFHAITTMDHHIKPK